MPRRNPTKRQTTLTWTSDDEPYNDAAMRTFVELFQAQHDNPIKWDAMTIDEFEGKFHEDEEPNFEGLDQCINELVRRRIARKMKR